MIGASFRMFHRQIFADSMLAVCCVAPIIAGFAFRFGVPALDLLAVHFLGRPVLRPYYPLVDLFLCVLSPFLICFASSMVMLDERDEGIGAYLMVTPVGKRGYIVSRLFLPAAFAVVVSAAVLAVFGLSDFRFPEIMMLALGTGLLAVILSLFITALSGNRIEGMAFGKLSGLVLLGIAVPFFTDSPYRFLAGFLPSFWVAEAALHSSPVSSIAFICICAAWFAALYPRFASRTVGR